MFKLGRLAMLPDDPHFSAEISDIGGFAN